MTFGFPLNLKKIPEKPGVYLFLDQNQKPIYVGKAVNLANRIKSHVQNKKENVSRLAKFLKIMVFDSEIAALIEESKLIKKFLPKLNVVFKDDKQYFYLCFSDNPFPRISILHQPKGFCLGPFTDGRALKSSLSLVRKTFSFCTCKTPHLRKCLNSQIGLCLGFCCEKTHLPIKKEVELYQKNITNIKKIFSGQDKSLKKEITKQIKQTAKNQNFEAAQVLKLQLLGLEKIFSHQKYLILENSFENLGSSLPAKQLEKLTGAKLLQRVEFYDSSQLQGSNRVGAMAVWQSGKYLKNEWRLFKIKNKKAKDDLAMLKEILQRRFSHPEWQQPDILIVDGGKNQLKIARDEIKDSKIKILALQKNSKHQPEQLLILQDNKKTAKVIELTQLSKNLKNFLENFSEKTHSFAISFHRKRRDKI